MLGYDFLRRALKERGTTAMKQSCGTFRRLPARYVGKLTEMNLINSWPQKKIRSRSRWDST